MDGYEIAYNQIVNSEALNQMKHTVNVSCIYCLNMNMKPNSKIHIK